MGILFIGEDERQAIEQAVSAARAKPMPWSVMREVVIDDHDHPTDTLTLGEREQQVDANRLAEIKREYPSHFVQLGTYVVAISFEEQPSGLMRHLSIASSDANKAPNEHAVAMAVKAFGFSAWPPVRPYRVWIEEYEPGRTAINLVELEPQ